MPQISIRDFLDLEAIIAQESEDELWEEEHNLEDLVDDDESASEDEADAIPLTCMPSAEAQGLEDETRRIEVRAAQATRVGNTSDGVALPFRVPRQNDPKIWSVSVKLGREADVVFQIARRCLGSSGIYSPAITSAFARSSIPGFVFIEAFDVAEVRRAVYGFVVVRNKQPMLIEPTEYVGILSWRGNSSSRIENGRWVCCLAGKYRDDVGYVCESSSPMYEWCAVVAFVPRISQPGSKRKRDGRPAPRAWTTEELVRQHGEKRVKILGPGQVSFKGCLYQDGLAFELIPMTVLSVLEHSPRDITPFVLSTRIRTLPAFATSLKYFAQDSIQSGDRVMVVSGEHVGIIGRTNDIRDNVADVVTQIPERHSGLMICVALRDLIPHFLPGDHVKVHWLDCFGIVIAVDYDARKVIFLDKATNTEIKMSAFSLHFYSSPLQFFHFTPGLYVDFSGANGAMHRGVVVSASGSMVQISEEKTGQRVDVQVDDITVSGVQGAALPKPERNQVWEGKRVIITKGPLKGYRGLVKAEDHSGVDVELDAKLTSQGQTRQRVTLGDLQAEPEHVPMTVASCSRADRTPPPDDLPRSISPEPEGREDSPAPWELPRKHWLFADEIQERLIDRCVPFDVQGVPASYKHAGLEGGTVKTVLLSKRKIEPEPDEVVVYTTKKSKMIQISMDPSYLVPWPTFVSCNVLIVGLHRIGRVGKVVEKKLGGLAVELEPSGEIEYFEEKDVVNLHRR